ncbi:UMP-CMP kinase 3 isoform X1 [Selaginella moellendorffii]|nr:UMP-CMP kinase 3 isoform X1 [Selaginella moellendorffii]|eukprot:XP_024516087.1 UMP-CMP kinase 3 isoform X1 [Selaginella moellendorffii]
MLRGRRALSTLVRSLWRVNGGSALRFAAICEWSSPASIPSLLVNTRKHYFSFGARLMALTAEVATPAPPTLATEDGTKQLIDPKVIFVLGGPGSGKGTQCAKIVEKFGFVHLSAGDLLRAEINSGSANGTMIQNMIQEGKIVPSEVTVKLLQKAMAESGKDKFLIDGFPRNQENRAAFEAVTGIEPEFILFFDCPQEEMEVRLLGRNQGRSDDNIETIRKRFKVFVESSLPVVDHYDKKGKVRKVNAAKTKEEVFESIETLFQKFQHRSVMQHVNAA